MSDDVSKPRCYDCLTEDVSVKLIDQMGFEHWFCAEDWAAEQEFSAKVKERDVAEVTQSSRDAIAEFQARSQGLPITP